MNGGEDEGSGGGGEEGILYMVGGMQWKSVWRLLKKLKIELPFDPAIPLLDVYLKKCKSACNRDIYTLMFIAALFTIAKQ
jgi:hypothetical protein